jgi:hypothetical protein
MLEWLRHLLGGRRFRVVKQAASCLERAQGFQKNGRPAEALALVREGLALLSIPSVDRRGAAEGTALVGLTTLAEELAEQLGEPGAERRDLVDTLAHLARLTDAMTRFPDLAAREPQASQELRLKWIPYLEQRLGTGQIRD